MKELLGYLVFWLTVLAWVSFMVDNEKAWAKSEQPPDGLIPVNRRIVDMAARQL